MELINRQTNLPAHVIQFVRFLRKHKFKTSPNEELDLLKAMLQSIPKSIEHQKLLFKSILVKNRKQFLLFDKLYDTYWEELSRAEDSKLKDVEEKSQKPAKKSLPSNHLAVLKDWLYNGKVTDQKEISSYSSFETLSKQNFTDFNAEEQKEFLEIIKIIAKQLSNKYNRRWVKSNRSNFLDLKKTLRKAMVQGLEINQFYFKEQQKRKVAITLICDVSKSMELYSQFLIQFMYGFQQVVSSLKTYVFSTKLVSVSHMLDSQDFSQVLKTLSEEIPQWASGTRLAESLDQFVVQYGHRNLNKNNIVIILSDGWDTGDSIGLEKSMKLMHRKCDKIIWLNPLASNPNYKPETKAMKMCLPFIDIFSSAHNLQSLKEISRQLY